MSMKRRKEMASLKERYTSQVAETRETRLASHTTVSGTRVTETRIALKLSTPVAVLKAGALSPPMESLPSEPASESTSPKKTQVSEQLGLFMEHESQLLDWMFERHADSLIGTPCGCSSTRVRTTRCYDCQFGPTCPECFIAAHVHSPTHWAEIWDSERGFFVRHDISAVRDTGYAIDLGHPGSRCPSLPQEDPGVLFYLIDVNGIHQTRVRFCHCVGGKANRAEQLMRCRLFPATMTRPTMAFSWQLCHYVHLLQAESKSALYDVVGSLRRLTNNCFSQDIPDPYPQFRVVMRVWRKLTAMKRLGQSHGIDLVLPGRKAGNLIVHCPSCLEHGVNTEEGWEKTPDHLRHLNQTQLTIDGNHHLNKFIKNTDPDDISLFQGRSFFPSDKPFRDYIRSIPNNALEKTTCLNLNAINGQDRKKFKNMDITGVVQVQCGHIFVKSTVDLQLGERFANADYALAHAFCQQTSSTVDKQCVLPGSDHLVSYDISCAFSVNILDRFKQYFPDLVDAVSKFRWLIPLVHVNNHKENCDYLFSSAFMECANHFWGESAEMIWPHSNLLGPQTRQMNNGHRHDTIIDHNNDWNHKKVVNLATMLFNELTDAKRLFTIKREAFENLTTLFSKQVAEWNLLDRSARTRNRSGQVICVYRHTQAKVPSQARIYQTLLEELSASPSSVTTRGNGLPSFLNDGVSIWSMQQKIRAKAKELEKDPSSSSAELVKERRQLQTRIDKWRKVQQRLMPQLGNHVENGSTKAVEPELVKLFLPSDLLDAERISLHLVDAAELQRKLLEGAAFDVIHRLRTIVKALNISTNDKRKNARGQKANTRANTTLNKIKAQRDSTISEYNAIRVNLHSLGLPSDDTTFPPLTIEDTEMKRTDLRRQPGDTHRTDGLLWTRTGVTLGDNLPSTAACHPESVAASSSRAALGAQGSKAKKRTKTVMKGAPKGKRREKRLENAKDADRVARKRKPVRDSWLWKFAPGRLTKQELADWIEEGDRVQWFRAEAEMQRWQEQVEKKQSDFLHAIRYFDKLSDIWTKLSLGPHESIQHGRAAYAKRTAANFSAMAATARALFKQAGYEDRLSCTGKILADFVQADRDRLQDIVAEVINAKSSSASDCESEVLSDSDVPMDVD